MYFEKNPWNDIPCKKNFLKCGFLETTFLVKKFLKVRFLGITFLLKRFPYYVVLLHLFQSKNKSLNFKVFRITLFTGKLLSSIAIQSTAMNNHLDPPVEPEGPAWLPDFELL
jgi:hypothetical protein